MEYPVSFTECEKMGGHCWMYLGPAFEVSFYGDDHRHERCKHCGATRTGKPQEDVRWEEPVPLEENKDD